MDQTRTEKVPQPLSTHSAGTVDDLFVNPRVDYCDYAMLSLCPHHCERIKFYFFMQLVIVFPAANAIMDSLSKRLELIVFQRCVVLIGNRHRPESSDQEFCPVDGRRTGPNTVVILRKFLSLHHALPSAAGAAVHVGKLNGSLVENLRNRFAKNRHLMGGVSAPVFNAFRDSLAIFINGPVGTVLFVAGITGCGSKAIDQSEWQCPASLPVVRRCNLRYSTGAGTTASGTCKPIIPGQGRPDKDILPFFSGTMLDMNLAI